MQAGLLCGGMRCHGVSVLAPPVLLLLLSIAFFSVAAETSNIGVDFVRAGLRPLPMFWPSCGWCPPDPHKEFNKTFLTEEERQNHILIGSVPHGGIKYVRIHYLLDLLHVVDASRVPGGAANTNFTIFTSGYLAGKALNWTDLDASLDIILDAGLYPGFEVMGNPSGNLFSSFQDDSQLSAWADMCHALARRYIHRYGAHSVRQWRFESWNEPDGECQYDLDANIKCDVPSFLNYFDATEYGLHKADPQLIYGGPASNGDHAFLYALVQHCLDGKHYVTGEPGCGSVHYFNAHLKGHSNSVGILDKEVPVATMVYQAIRGTNYSKTRWGNDEADPLVGWEKMEPWRADARYPAMVTKTIRQHLDYMVYSQALEGLQYDILSNDNAFLNYPDNGQHTFSQRTLTARFAMNSTNTVEFVRKPVLNVMALLALLGDTSSIAITGVGVSRTAAIGVIPSLRVPAAASSAVAPAEATVVLYNSQDSSAKTGRTTVSLTLKNLPSQLIEDDNAVVVAFVLNNTHGSAQHAWQDQGSPNTPSPAQLRELRQAMEIPMLPQYPRALNLSGTSATFDNLPLSLPGIVALHACAKPSAPPPQPNNVRLHRTTSAAPPEVLVYWDEPRDVRCVLTYEVHFSSTLKGPFRRVNKANTIFTAFLHAEPSPPAVEVTPRGCYRVRTVDYWDRSSELTEPICD